MGVVAFSRVAFPLAIGSLAASVGALGEAKPTLPVFVGGQCAERYPAISAAIGAPTCATTAETLALLEDLRLSAN